MRFSKLSLAITTTLVTANALAQSVELDSINVIATRDPSRFAYTPENNLKIVFFPSKRLVLQMP